MNNIDNTKNNNNDDNSNTDITKIMITVSQNNQNRN